MTGIAGGISLSLKKSSTGTSATAARIVQRSAKLGTGRTGGVFGADSASEDEDKDVKSGSGGQKDSRIKSKAAEQSAKREQNKPSLASVLGADDDNNELDGANKDNSLTSAASTANKSSKGASLPKSQRPSLSSTLANTKLSQPTKAEDSSIYDYDAAFDAQHAAETAAKQAARTAAADRKPKYMGGLIASAEQRKRDQLRAKDKLLQREREAEGEEFADKEKYVTAAYREQQEETRRAEEQEQAREEEETRKRRERGMAGFYRQQLEERERRNQEQAEAVERVKRGDVDLTEFVTEEEDQRAKDEKRARELQALGVDVEINAEGEVVDKRGLLDAGLNLGPKKQTSARSSVNGADTSRHAGAHSSAHLSGREAHQGRQAMRERHTRLIEEQLEASQKRQAEEEAEDLHKRQMSAKSKKSDTDVTSARERYLQRKREKEAEASREKQGNG